MTWIILLLVVGILLFFIELFFVPGTTVVGILGFILVALGIYFAYADIGTQTGHITLAITVLSLIIIIIIGAKTNVWTKLSNKDHLTGKANLLDEEVVKLGDKGVSISAIKPIGKARINNKNFEVRSLGAFIDENTDNEVIKVQGNRITVAPSQPKA
jgi:membrane-bound ClpP family serine protease